MTVESGGPPSTMGRLGAISALLLFLIFFSSSLYTYLYTRGANDASRVRVQSSSSRVVNISSRARARVELTPSEF